MPAATFTHTVDSSADLATTWAALQDPEIWSSIGPVNDVTNPRFLDDGTLAGFDWVADVGGKRYNGKAVSGPYEPQQRFTLSLDTSEIAGDVETTLMSLDSGTRVSVTLTMRTKGMLSSMFFPAIRAALASGFPNQVDELVAAVAPPG